MQSSPEIQRLAASLSDAVCKQRRDVLPDAWQDALDCLAVAAGMKPLALVGCGFDAPDFLTMLDETMADAGFSVISASPWTSVDEPRVSWWREGRQSVLAAKTVLYVTTPVNRREIAGLAGGRVDSATQAAALDYPICCVREFNRQQRMLHLITLRMIARQAGCDESRMRRFVEAEVVPTPRTSAESRWLAVATRAEFAPYTSVAMCRSCARDPASPARHVSSRFARLAAELGFDANLSRPAL